MKFDKDTDPLLHSGRSGYSLDEYGNIPNPLKMPEEWLSNIDSFSTNYGHLYRLYGEYLTLEELIYKIKIYDRKLKLKKLNENWR